MLIQNDTELRKYLPNALTTVEGETPLYDKISPYLAKAHAWLAKHFTGTDILTAIEASAPADTLRELCAHIVAVDAFRRAIPSLDLILTPNGFGIVSNQNIVPASADRVKRLIDSLLTNRDSLANTLLDSLAKRTDWLETEQASFFGASLWPDLELSRLAGHSNELWAHYQSLRLQVLSIEQELAEHFVSEELITRLRHNMLTQQVTPEERSIIDGIRQTTLEMLAGKPLDFKRMSSVVQRIRTKPALFPEWQDSYTSMLFCRPSFENHKDSGGYWW